MWEEELVLIDHAGGKRVNYRRRPSHLAPARGTARYLWEHAHRGLGYLTGLLVVVEILLGLGYMTPPWNRRLELCFVAFLVLAGAGAYCIDKAARRDPPRGLSPLTEASATSYTNDSNDFTSSSSRNGSSANGSGKEYVYLVSEERLERMATDPNMVMEAEEELEWRAMRRSFYELDGQEDELQP